MTDLPPVVAPAFDEEVAVLIASAILWKAADQQGPLTSAELRRRAAVYARWAKVYLATEAGLLRAADAIEAPVPAPAAKVTSAKPKKPASQAPGVGPKIRRSPAKKGLVTPVTAIEPWTPPPAKGIPKPPPMRRAVVD